MFDILSTLGGGLMTALPALFLGGSSIAGGLIGGAMNAKEASKTRKWQAEQNKIQRDWLTEMSNTAHQREVDDLRAAGLNPLLSGKYGGASTPSYSGQSAAPADVGSMVAKGMSGAVENVLGMYNAVNNAKLTRAQASLADANAIKALSDAERNNWERDEAYDKLQIDVRRVENEERRMKTQLDYWYDKLALENSAEQRRHIETEIKIIEAGLKNREQFLKEQYYKLDNLRFENQKRQELYENIRNGIDTVAGGFTRGIGFGVGARAAQSIFTKGGKIGFGF